MNKECIACGILKNELTALYKEGFLSQMPRFVASRMHMDPEGLDVIVSKMVSKPDTEVSLIYGDCCPKMLDTCELEHVNRPTSINCCELLLGKAQYNQLVREGAFFLLPEWLENWREIFEDSLGLTPEVAKELMEERCFKLIYLDTGLCPIPLEKLKECSEFMSMKVEIMQVGLESLKKALIEANIARQTESSGHA